jgi:hypothetical protein
MKFIRRPDLDRVTRAEIAAQAVLARGVYGEMTRLARCYRVSRFFIYTLRWQFTDTFAEPPAVASQAVARRAEMDRLILLLRHVGCCSLESMAHIATVLGCPFHSVSYLSQRLKAFAQALPKQVVAARQWVVLLADEIFAGGQPILITVEPRSLAILKIELATEREATTWQRHWQEFVDAGAVERIVVGRAW